MQNITYIELNLKQDQIDTDDLDTDFSYLEYMKETNSPSQKNNTPYRTCKEIADSLIEKEKVARAKHSAMRSRRREFGSQRARLILIMIEDGQDYICSECQSEEDLTVDHIYPLSKGGTDEPSNLAFLCRRCNSKKGDK